MVSPNPNTTTHESDATIHQRLLKIIKEQYQSNDYKLEVITSKKDFYAKAILEAGQGDSRKAYFKLDGRQRIPTVMMLTSVQLAKWEISIGQKYRVYVPGGGQVATLRPEG